MVSQHSQTVNLSGAEFRTFWQTQVNTMTADALTPYVTKPSAAMVWLYTE